MKYNYYLTLNNWDGDKEKIEIKGQNYLPKQGEKIFYKDQYYDVQHVCYAVEYNKIHIIASIVYDGDLDV